jgi:TPR repeat protein
MTERKHASETSPLANETSHLAKGSENPLTHQERVYFEMFRAIELLGRKLEKSENTRVELARRLSDLESAALRDDVTGKYYLPAKIEPAGLPVAPEAVMTRRLTLGAALTGLALGTLALGLVLMQQSPQPLSPRQMAALNNLTEAQTKPVFADHISGGWHKVVENNTLAPVVEENVTVEVAAVADALPIVKAAAETPQRFELAAALEHLQESTTAALSDTLEADLPEEMAQGDTDVTEEEAGLDHADLAALVAQENAVDESFADVPMQGPQAAAPASTVVPVGTDVMQEAAATAEPAPKRTVYTAAPLRDPYLPSVYADLERRAYDGIGEAQHDLAALYAAGGRVRPDYPRAVYWFRHAADEGIANAYYNLGVMAQQGLGMAKDAAEAFAFYGRAARLGHPEAMYNLGLAYIEGRGTKKDNLRGISYFKKAANAGLTQAAYNLGVIYEGGTIEGQRDLKSALEWYHVAAVEGHSDAEAAIRRVEKLHMQAEALSIADKVEPAAGK